MKRCIIKSERLNLYWSNPGYGWVEKKCASRLTLSQAIDVLNIIDKAGDGEFPTLIWLGK